MRKIVVDKHTYFWKIKTGNLVVLCATTKKYKTIDAKEAEYNYRYDADGLGGVTPNKVQDFIRKEFTT